MRITIQAEVEIVAGTESEAVESVRDALDGLSHTGDISWYLGIEAISID